MLYSLGTVEEPMRFGIHVPRKRTLSETALYAASIGCQAFQIFSGNPVGWTAARLDGEDAEGFAREVAASGMGPVLVHAPYIINLASPDRALRARSTRTLVEAMERAAALRAGPVVVHAGNYMGGDPNAGVSRALDMVQEVLDGSPPGSALAIEGGAGKGTEIGVSFGELAMLVAPFPTERVGVVLDTAHLWALGHDLREPEAVARVIREFGAGPGLDRLWGIHANDSLAERGSRRDRHAHWTDGRMGRRGLRNIVGAKELAELPAIFEVPGETAELDRRRLASMRRLDTRLRGARKRRGKSRRGR